MNTNSVQEVAQPRKFVAVVADGPVYRWRRTVGPGTSFISREGFTALHDAIEAAQVIARCYGVPLRRSVAVEPPDHYVPFQGDYSDVQPDYMREDWIGD